MSCQWDKKKFSSQVIASTALFMHVFKGLTMFRAYASHWRVRNKHINDHKLSYFLNMKLKIISKKEGCILVVVNMQRGRKDEKKCLKGCQQKEIYCCRQAAFSCADKHRVRQTCLDKTVRNKSWYTECMRWSSWQIENISNLIKIWFCLLEIGTQILDKWKVWYNDKRRRTSDWWC